MILSDWLITVQVSKQIPCSVVRHLDNKITASAYKVALTQTLPYIEKKSCQIEITN